MRFISKKILTTVGWNHNSAGLIRLLLLQGECSRLNWTKWHYTFWWFLHGKNSKNTDSSQNVPLHETETRYHNCLQRTPMDLQATNVVGALAHDLRVPAPFDLLTFWPSYSFKQVWMLFLLHELEISSLFPPIWDITMRGYFLSFGLELLSFPPISIYKSFSTLTDTHTFRLSTFESQRFSHLQVLSQIAIFRRVGEVKAAIYSQDSLVWQNFS